MLDVQVKGLSKSFGGTRVLEGIDLSIGPGEFVVLLGPSGCGKSTLLNLIAGLENVDGGQVLIGGQDVTHMEPSRRGIAMVFQTYALFPTMTVRGNLTFGLKVQKTPRDEIARRVASVAKLLQIEPLLDRKPSQLSGGQRQRVAIGRALVRSTRLCLFDEPLSNLDAKLRMETRVEIKKLHAELGMTVIYVTHDQVEAMTMADRVAVIRDGRIEQFDPPQLIYNKPATRFVADFVGSPSMNFLRGTLEGRENPVFRSGDDVLPLNGYEFSGQHGREDLVDLGIRPEDLKFAARDGDGRPKLKADVDIIESVGPDSLVWLNCRKNRWAMRVSTETATEIPNSIEITFNPMRASLFSASDGQRI